MWDEELDMMETFEQHDLEYTVEDSFSDLEVDFESPEADEFDDD